MNKDKIKENVFIRLTSDIQDPYTPINAGAIMAVSHIDDAGQINGTWLEPYKSALAVIPEVDNFEVIEGGMDEIKRLKAEELYNNMVLYDDISKSEWYDLMSASIEDFYNRNITELELGQKAWESFFEYQVTHKK